MAPIEPSRQREFAVEVVRRLQQGGFVAYFAGGCVRDQLLGREPKDFDVATSARPEQIGQLMSDRRTLSIGAAFGVITVVGPRRAGQIDVATFRRDDVYSDGRHPDRVHFSSAEEDARRRDFTINGMFFDPIVGEVVDFVGGQADLERGIVRAIGPPEVRLAEDKLRMLRAVRSSAALAFELDEQTAAAVTRMADELAVVSAERVAMEMRRMLVDPHRLRAVVLLRQTRLLSAALGGVQLPEGAAWDRTLRLLDHLDTPSFPLALAVLLAEFADDVTAAELGRRWRLASRETERTCWLLANRDALAGAARQPWPGLQRILVHPGAADLLAWSETRGAIGQFDPQDLEFCRERLAWPAERLDPPALLTGDDLIAHGVPQGRAYRTLLSHVRDAQLLGQIHTRPEALALVDRLGAESKETP